MSTYDITLPLTTVIELIKEGCQQMRIEHHDGNDDARIFVRNDESEHWGNGPFIPASSIEQNVKVIADQGYTVNRIK